MAINAFVQQPGLKINERLKLNDKKDMNKMTGTHTVLIASIIPHHLLCVFLLQNISITKYLACIDARFATILIE